jgi:hypothetical protein
MPIGPSSRSIYRKVSLRIGNELSIRTRRMPRTLRIRNRRLLCRPHRMSFSRGPSSSFYGLDPRRPSVESGFLTSAMKYSMVLTASASTKFLFEQTRLRPIVRLDATTLGLAQSEWYGRDEQTLVCTSRVFVRHHDRPGHFAARAMSSGSRYQRALRARLCCCTSAC